MHAESGCLHSTVANYLQVNRSHLASPIDSLLLSLLASTTTVTVKFSEIPYNLIYFLMQKSLCYQMSTLSI